MRRYHFASAQAGLTYVEVLVAASLLAIALIPAIDALNAGILGSEILMSETEEHYAVLARMEEVLAESHANLASSAEIAGSQTTPSNYSDPNGAANRVVVFIARYDADDADGDGNLFTVPDPDVDGDGNPYTDYSGLLWVRVKVKGAAAYVDSLVAP